MQGYILRESQQAHWATPWEGNELLIGEIQINVESGPDIMLDHSKFMQQYLKGWFGRPSSFMHGSIFEQPRADWKNWQICSENALLWVVSGFFWALKGAGAGPCISIWGCPCQTLSLRLFSEVAFEEWAFTESRASECASLARCPQFFSALSNQATTIAIPWACSDASWSHAAITWLMSAACSSSMCTISTLLNSALFQS